ncbi:CBS domain-containing protein [Chelativorans sp. YIM 93263]|uniref:CBS domain-containing protein n=1 Tax=Chelativorans sp. YIM 93263 TaxID=2906648 RepID=UPI00237883C0|nr:CBS domain-containing protein [Chelativorans sp. YIM 93263]
MAFRLFVPILAGATLRERLLACIGAMTGIALTGVISALANGNGPYIALLVALNSAVLVALGFIFHLLSRRNYPHVHVSAANSHGIADRPPVERVGFQPEDVDTALSALDEIFDISRDDLERLLRQVELQALVRSQRMLLCRDIMSRDVVSVRENASADEARKLLLDHNIRTLPVTDADSRLVGAVGLRELTTATDTVRGMMSKAGTASPDTPAMRLLPVLTDGRSHAVVMVNAEQRILGLITQTDLLAAAARVLTADTTLAAA